MSDFQPSTTFYLLQGVPLDHSHKNTIWFDSADDQLTYFKKFIAKTVEHGTYQRKTVSVINVPFAFDSVARCNYVLWQNADTSNKWYYAFVLQAKYVNPNTTQIIYDLDVIQTYMFDMEFKECYINRQHETRFEVNAKGQKMAWYRNRESEELDYGSNYMLYSEKDLGEPSESNKVGYMVGAYTYGNDTTTAMASRIPLNLHYFIVPVRIPGAYETSIRETYFRWTASDGTQTLLTTPEQVLKQFSTNTDLVNSLVSLKFYPFVPGDITVAESSDTNYYNVRSALDYKLYTTLPNIVVIAPTPNSPMNPKFISQYYRNVYESDALPQYSESKLYMYPYTFGVLTNRRGDEKVIKLEDINPDLTVGSLAVNLYRWGSLSNSPKLGYAISNYLCDDNAPIIGDNWHVNIEETLVEELDTDVPIIDDYTASYVQSNANAIKASKSNAQAYLQSAQQQANNTYNTGQQVLNNKSEQAYNNYVANITTGSLNAVGSFASSVARSPIGSTVNLATNLATTGISASNTKAQEDMAIRNSALQEKNSLKNANISATTDYQTTIATINAKYQDAQNIPATAKSLGSDYLFSCLSNSNSIYFQIKTIAPYYADKLTKYFQMYGYKCNTREVPNLHTRKSWNYIKMADANIYGNIPQDDLMAIRDIFMCGITLWHTEDVGNYSLDNDEI